MKALPHPFRTVPSVLGFRMPVLALFTVLPRRRFMKRYLYYSSLEPVLANFGFLLQFSGCFFIPSIIYAFYLQESSAATALLITASVYLSLGFMLSFLYEPKMPSMKQSCQLLVLFFTIVPLVNCIPYLYLGVFEGNVLAQLLNSWFETSSAVSTTGLTLMEGMTVPRSLILARGISEWIGGIGIIFMLLPFFYPSSSLSQYGRALGIDRITKDYRSSFLVVLLIYIVYTLFYSGILILLGMDAFTAFHTTFTVYSTTGLTIVNVLNLPIPAIVVITVLMLLSTLSFSVHLRFFSFLFQVDWRMLIRANLKAFKTSFSKIDWKTILTNETKIYLILLLFYTLVFWQITGLPLFRAFFHIVDFSSSCGLNLVPFDAMSDSGKVFLALVMLIGPCSFSVGGGVRILRLYVFGKMLFTLPRTFLTGESPKLKLEEDELDIRVIVIHLMTVTLFIMVTFLAALILCNYGYSFADALVESASAITTTGDSPKVLTPGLPSPLRLLLGVLMLLGRIEIMPVFIAFSRESEKRVSE